MVLPHKGTPSVTLAVIGAVKVTSSVRGLAPTLHAMLAVHTGAVVLICCRLTGAPGTSWYSPKRKLLLHAISTAAGVLCLLRP